MSRTLRSRLHSLWPRAMAAYKVPVLESSHSSAPPSSVVHTGSAYSKHAGMTCDCNFHSFASANQQRTRQNRTQCGHWHDNRTTDWHLSGYQRCFSLQEGRKSPVKCIVGKDVCGVPKCCTPPKMQFSCPIPPSGHASPKKNTV